MGTFWEGGYANPFRSRCQDPALLYIVSEAFGCSDYDVTATPFCHPFTPVHLNARIGIRLRGAFDLQLLGTYLQVEDDPEDNYRKGVAYPSPQSRVLQFIVKRIKA